MHEQVSFLTLGTCLLLFIVVIKKVYVPAKKADCMNEVEGGRGVSSRAHKNQPESTELLLYGDGSTNKIFACRPIVLKHGRNDKLGM